MKTVLAPFAVITALSATAAIAAPVSYDFDPSHSQVVFDYQHMGFSTSTGIINGVTGKLVLDRENPSASTVEATIPMSGLHSVAAELDEHLFGKDFFNANKAEAVATFKSTAVEVDDDQDEAKVTGDLTLNGVTKTIVLDVDLKQIANHPMSGKEVAGFDAETEIKRSEFNLGQFAPAVSDEVEINISVEAIKAE
ncbi:YceI family protein [Paracoccus laeviglucosivorans]|uniref:Polyisoprenoid-binding protein YceI n=1 Tax=Paracoccus laeviglucosivorans TaxID=1197861 RepID=A0A521CD78_9RHOB|nr:YceI family protein [Paracoccus laeviglucosivorans]SMO57377.1 Polyisoprenoid-binding protein YceI [Paracoccus laeviglucosivorans]